jgi:hypothetical protein
MMRTRHLALLLAGAALGACARAPEPASPPAASANAMPSWLPTRGEDEHGKLEVEVTGTVRDQIKARKYLVFVLAAPCTLSTLDQAKPLGGIDSIVGYSKEKMFGFEAVIPHGSRGYLCALALDAGSRVVGFGRYDHNPLVINRTPGEEYAHVRGVEIPLARVQPAWPLTQRFWKGF